MSVGNLTWQLLTIFWDINLQRFKIIRKSCKLSYRKIALAINHPQEIRSFVRRISWNLYFCYWMVTVGKNLDPLKFAFPRTVIQHTFLPSGDVYQWPSPWSLACTRLFPASFGMAVLLLGSTHPSEASETSPAFDFLYLFLPLVEPFSLLVLWVPCFLEASLLNWLLKWQLCIITKIDAVYEEATEVWDIKEITCNR